MVIQFLLAALSIVLFVGAIASIFVYKNEPLVKFILVPAAILFLAWQSETVGKWSECAKKKLSSPSSEELALSDNRLASSGKANASCLASP